MEIFHGTSMVTNFKPAKQLNVFALVRHTDLKRLFVLGSNAIVKLSSRGSKHDFPFINICKVPREVLKTEGEARGFQPSRGTLQMLMNDKIMLDRYCCINSRNISKIKKILGHFIL